MLVVGRIAQVFVEAGHILCEGFEDGPAVSAEGLHAGGL